MNCIIVDDDPLFVDILELFIDKIEFLNLAKKCSRAMEAFNYLIENEVDLIFLDIRMPEMTGMEFLKLQETLPQIILISTDPDYALESYEYEVTDYLVKPVNSARFLKAVSKAKNIFDNQNVDLADKSKGIYVKVDSTLVKLNTDEIEWVQAYGDYVNVNISGHKQYTIHSTLKSVENKLPGSKFLRVHRSYIINVEKITVIEDDLISLDKKLIPIGKNYKSLLMKRLKLL
ncbi:MAG: response regulator transcription factor [Bacteroidia bacterium]|nr:response regulator transcription factor [Bacteroidia bacterium]